MEDFQPEQTVRKPTKEEIQTMKSSAKRNVALCILPTLCETHPKSTPTSIVKRAYAIAEQMILQGDKV